VISPENVTKCYLFKVPVSPLVLDYPVSAHIFFLVLPSLLSYLHRWVPEGSSYSPSNVTIIFGVTTYSIIP
jgi:hypothetical protein